MKIRKGNLLTASVTGATATAFNSNDFTVGDITAGGFFGVSLSAMAATSVVLKFQWKDLDGNYWDLPGATNTSGLAAGGKWTLGIGPNFTAVAAANTVTQISSVIPLVLRLTMTVTGSGTCTVDKVTFEGTN
jgi:hypothetical protein